MILFLNFIVSTFDVLCYFLLVRIARAIQPIYCSMKNASDTFFLTLSLYPPLPPSLYHADKSVLLIIVLKKQKRLKTIKKILVPYHSESYLICYVIFRGITHVFGSLKKKLLFPLFVGGFLILLYKIILISNLSLGQGWEPRTLGLFKLNGTNRIALIHAVKSFMNCLFSFCYSSPNLFSFVLFLKNNTILSQDDQDRTIEKLTRQLDRGRRKCEVYRSNLLSILKDIEEQKLQLSVKVQNIKLEMKD